MKKYTDDEAVDLLFQAVNKLSFLQAIFERAPQEGESFELPGCMALGLAAILQDLKHDVRTATDFFDTYVDTVHKEPSITREVEL